MGPQDSSDKRDLLDLERRYGTTAMRLMKSSGIPPTPQFYELLYTYATGVNEKLNQRLNTLLNSGEKLDSQRAQSLYKEFFQPRDMGQKLDSVSAELTSRINAIHGALDHATHNASNYTDVLEAASGNLETGMDTEALKSLTLTVLSETKEMQRANTELESQLDNSRSDITALQQELDNVRREALTDPLTRIDNRKSFDRALETATVTAIASGEPTSLLMIDIDYFKKFNDTFGHQAGDQVLRLVAKTLTANLKPEDTAARYGGEEFAVILPDTGLDTAVDVASRLREAVESKVLRKRSTNENLGRVTISIGVAVFRPGDSVQTFIERADQCLYAAKDRGRNKVVCENDDESQHQSLADAGSAA